MDRKHQKAAEKEAIEGDEEQVRGPVLLRAGCVEQERRQHGIAEEKEQHHGAARQAEAVTRITRAPPGGQMWTAEGDCCHAEIEQNVEEVATRRAQRIVPAGSAELKEACREPEAESERQQAAVPAQLAVLDSATLVLGGDRQY